VLLAICTQTIKPNEIVIIDSSNEDDLCDVKIKEICIHAGVELNHVRLSIAMPGHARNVGLGIAKGELIAFIDVQTIPRVHWLETSVNLIESNSALGVWGSTLFIAETQFEELIRDGIHGTLSRRTLPGLVCKREVIVRVGLFIDWVRAGEDTEWIIRAELLKLPFLLPSSPLLDYYGLIGYDLKSLIRKWYRNYTASRNLPHLFPQRIILWIILYPLVILIAFNWNYLIADWRIDSPMYVGHVTKIATVLPILGYITLRGFILPFKRGVILKELLPFRFLAITLICFMADLVKVLVFSIPKKK
jgi:hypothetical protein